MIRMIGTGKENPKVKVTGVSGTEMETAILIATPHTRSLIATLISQDMNQEVIKATWLRIPLLR